MAALLVRDLDEGVKEKLKKISRANGRSLEAQVRYILSQEVGKAEYAWISPDKPDNFYDQIRQTINGDYFDEVELPPRDSYPREDAFNDCP